MTEWRPIPDYEDVYEVSDDGRVRNIRTGQVKKPTRRSTGHMFLLLWRKDKAHGTFVHVVMMAAFVGPKPPDQEVRHLNSIADDNRLENLIYGTRSDNMFDAVEQRTHYQARKTHCPHGHPYDADNTLIVTTTLKDGTPGFGRECKACRRAYQAKRRKRQ